MNLYSSMQELVASTNASAFVGRDLGTNGKWIRLVERLPMAVAIPSILVSYVPIPLRPLVEPVLFMPALWVRTSMKKLLTPIVKADMQEYENSENKKALLGPREKGKVQMTGWLMSRYRDPSKKKDVQTILNDHIATIFESTPSTAGALFFIMGELAADPKLADILRQELLDVAPDGQLPQTHLNELRKLDSVMRESTRVNPFSYRKVSNKSPRPCARKLILDYSRSVPQTPHTHQTFRRPRAPSRNHHLRRRAPHQHFHQTLGGPFIIRRASSLQKASTTLPREQIQICQSRLRRAGVGRWTASLPRKAVCG